MKMRYWMIYACVGLVFTCVCRAQVNSGSNGSDGALNPTQNVTIDMADHPDGIYHYTSVNIPADVTVSFIPNAGNKPVVWLVQENCTINGSIKVSANPSWNGSYESYPVCVQEPGPGGFFGGNGGTAATAGRGPGGGSVGGSDNQCRLVGGNGSFATAGGVAVWGSEQTPYQASPGTVYGNQFLLPLVGGSGGAGNSCGIGGGGGGAMLIAVSGTLTVNGSIAANGSMGGQAQTIYVNYPTGSGGAGSGGAVRLVASQIRGTGNISANGGNVYTFCGYGCGYWTASSGGSGRVRFDSHDIVFNGTIGGAFTQGFQPIIIPALGQGTQLAIQSVAGNSVPTNPSGVLANPDVIIPAQQANPIPIVVRCTNIPLNTEISVVVHPANGPDVQAVGLNHAGTTASSTATVSLNIPRGGGIIYAKAITGVAGNAAPRSKNKNASLAQTGWTSDGEGFAKMEIIATLGGSQRIAYITKSGKRHELPAK